jgi:hypothetical protein
MCPEEIELLYIDKLICLDAYGWQKTEHRFKKVLEDSGCSKKAAGELWKWYDSPEKKGVGSF